MFWRGRRCICYERTYPLGRDEHPARSAPDSKFRPAIRARCVDGDSPDGTPGIFSLRRFNPEMGVAMSPSLRACVPFTDRSPRFIFVAESSVRGEIKVRKRTGDHERFVWLPGFTPIFGPANSHFACRPILPWALPLSGFRVPIARDNRAGTTPPGSSASGSRFRPLSAHGFVGKTREMKLRRKQLCLHNRLSSLTRRCPEFNRRRPLPVPTACSRG